jgi:class 3 adenylate cyclase/ligand-binding sensor domain-containing protein
MRGSVLRYRSGRSFCDLSTMRRRAFHRVFPLQWLRASIPILLLVPQSAAAQDLSSPRAIDTLDLPFTALTINDGLSQGMVQAILQDRYGFMWFGTKDGLNRYDGYTFTVFRHEPADSTTVRESMITCLAEDAQDHLWVGTSSGLDLFDRGTEHFLHVPIRMADKEPGSVSHVVLDDNGDLWVACTNTLMKLTFERPLSRNAIPPFTVQVFANGEGTVTRTRDGTLWGSTDAIAFRARATHDGIQRLDTISRFKSGDPVKELGSLEVVEDTLRHKLYGIAFHVIAEIDPRTGMWKPLLVTNDDYAWLQCLSPQVDRDGVLWLATFKGLCGFDPASRRLSLVRASDPEMRNMSGTVKWTHVDRNGMVWVGSSGYGILKYDPRLARFNTVTDLSIRGLTAAANGTVLTARYEKFLSVYDPETRRYAIDLDEKPFLDHPELHAADPQAYNDGSFQDADGAYWLAINGLVRYDAATGALVRYRPEAGARFGYIADHDLFPIVPGRDGAIWCGSDSSLLRFDRGTRQYTGFRFPVAPSRDPYLFTQAIHEDAEGVVWVGTLQGLLRFDPRNGEWKHFAHRAGDEHTLAVDVLFCITPDPLDPDVLWIGTNGGGLGRFDKRTGSVDRFRTTEGLPNDVVYGVLSDARGNLWLSTNKGISRFTPSTGAFRNFAASDGLQSDEFNRYAYCKQADGTLFFGGVKGFNYFLPEALAEDSTPVPVRLTNVLLLNKPVEFGFAGSPLARPVYMSEGMEIPYSTNMITFQFATMEFADPARHRYQYQLDGFDPDWIMAGNAHEANYTNLDPGTYTFRVRGDNGDGIWSTGGTSFTLVVHPPWWMTWWFFSGCVLMITSGAFLYVDDLRRQKRRLERTVKERTAELRNEQDRNEDLLKNILPEEVAAELNTKGHTQARQFDRVTILFTNFLDRSRQGMSRTPVELVAEIDACFHAFDTITERHGVEKIKTIGDMYMCASGLPDPDHGSPLDVLHAALEMQAFMRVHRAEREAQGRPFFEMRAGVHSGAVVAGVVGVKKFAYDIWGDTVNIASRMESSGEPGQVNISGSTYGLVRDAQDLVFSARGKVQAKGKGEMEMYFVTHA